MNLLIFAIAGSLVSLVMMFAGMIWLGRRGEMKKAEMDPAQAASLVLKGWEGRPAATWFQGLARGISYSAQKPTREIIDLLKKGEFKEGLPWAVPALGALAALFFWPLLIGKLLGLESFSLWALVAFFFFSALYAAWPRLGK